MNKPRPHSLLPTHPHPHPHIHSPSLTFIYSHHHTLSHAPIYTRPPPPPHPPPPPLSPVPPPVERAASTFTGPLEETFVRLHQLANKSNRPKESEIDKVSDTGKGQGKDKSHNKNQGRIAVDSNHHHDLDRADQEWQAGFLTELRQALSRLTLDPLSRREARLAQEIKSDFAVAFETLATGTSTTASTTTSTPTSTGASSSANASSPPKKRSNTGSGQQPTKLESSSSSSSQSTTGVTNPPMLSSSAMDEVIDKVHSWTWKLQQHLTVANHHHHHHHEQQHRGDDWSSSTTRPPFAGTSHMFEYDNGTGAGVGGGVHGVSSGCTLEVGGWLWLPMRKLAWSNDRSTDCLRIPVHTLHPHSYIYPPPSPLSTPFHLLSYLS